MAKRKHKVKRRKLKMVLIILVVLVLMEVGALLWMKYTVGSYAKFWQAKAKESGEITYLALGDSAAQGIGATSPMRGYVGLVAKRLQAKTGKTVRIINLSVTGATIADCLKSQIPQIKDIKADYVTIEIGANDVRRTSVENFQKEFTDLVDKLPANTYVANLPLFNSRPGSTAPAKHDTTIVESVVRARSDLHLVDLQGETSRHQSLFGFAPDLFHPNNLSYKHWADAFWRAINR